MGSVVGAWRLKTMVFCFIMLTSLYLVQGIFMGVDGDSIDINKVEYSGDYINSSYDTQESFADSIVGVFAFISFTAIELPYGLDWLFTMFGIVVLIINIYLVYTYVKEWIPLT